MPRRFTQAQARALSTTHLLTPIRVVGDVHKLIDGRREHLLQLAAGITRALRSAHARRKRPSSTSSYAHNVRSDEHARTAQELQLAACHGHHAQATVDELDAKVERQRGQAVLLCHLHQPVHHDSTHLRRDVRLNLVHVRVVHRLLTLQAQSQNAKPMGAVRSEWL